MNKREVIWLIVKLVGLYFVFSAIFALFNLVDAATNLTTLPSSKTTPETVSPAPADANSFPGLTQQPGPQTRPTRAADPVADAAKTAAVKVLLGFFFMTVLYGGIGYYLIRDGGFLYNILAREGQGDPSVRSPDVVTLDLSNERRPEPTSTPQAIQEPAVEAVDTPMFRVE